VPGDCNRRIVWLIPCARIQGPIWMYCFQPKLLARRTYKLPAELVVSVNFIYESIEDRLSVAVDGEWQSVELTGRCYDAIRKRIHHKETPAYVSDVERILRESGDKNAAVNAPLLFQLVTNGEYKPNVVRTTIMQSTFQPVGPLVTEDGKPSGAVVAPALALPSAVFPAKGYNADIATVRGRVDGVRNDVKPGKKYEAWAQEFISLVVPCPGKGVPISVEEVRRHQSKATQRARFKQVSADMTSNFTNKLKAFIKSEAYPAANDPRNITTMSAEMTIQLSCFSLPFKAHMKRFEWYAPGLAPSEIAARLGSVCGGGDVIATDFSRMDGTVSEWLTKRVVWPVYMAWCNEKDRPVLRKLLGGVYVQVATTVTGVRYTPGYSIRSGCSITTECGTLVNAFVAYCALRKFGMDPARAIVEIGILFGDDGVVKLVHEGFDRLLEEAARELGLRLKSVVVHANCPVPFLGRYFVNPTIMPDSFQDPMRTITKLHLTANKNVTPEQALVNKASGYWTTDRLTPIIGTWAGVVRRQLGVKTKGMLDEEKYKCSNAWPQRDADAIMIAFAAVLGIEVGELRRIDQLVNDSPLDQLPAILQNPSLHRIEAVVGGDVVGTASRNNESEPEGLVTGMSTPGAESGCCSKAVGGRSARERKGDGEKDGGDGVTKPLSIGNGGTTKNERAGGPVPTRARSWHGNRRRGNARREGEGRQRSGTGFAAVSAQPT